MNIAWIRLLLVFSLVSGLAACGGGRSRKANPESRDRLLGDTGKMLSKADTYETPHSKAAEDAYQRGYEAGAKDRASGLTRSPTRHTSDASSSMRYYWNHGYSDGWKQAPRR